MCWNSEVSLNTFLFSIFTLAFVYYNNEYTKYKNPMFKNKWLYIFLLLVFFIQILEFFIWKNFKNKYNVFFTKCIFFLLILQPAAALMLISNINLRNLLLIPYLIIGFIFILNIILTNKIVSTISKVGHLKWNYFDIKIGNFKINSFLEWYWILLLLIPFFYQQIWITFFFGIITLCLCIYKEFNTVGSTWCWFINSLSFYLLFYLLIYLPLKENGLC